MVHRTLRSALALAVLFLFGGTACSDVAGPVAGPEPGSQVPTISAAISPTQVAKLLASDGAADDRFGQRVAVDGAVAVIGATGDDGVQGAAYVFERTSSGWSQAAKLTADDGVATDQFGVVAVDGDLIVVGARLDDDNGVDSGSAYVFERSGGVWSQVAKLTAPDGTGGDNFGVGVDVDGSTVIIGAPRDDVHASDSGSAYIFRRTTTGWSALQKLTPPSGNRFDLFGAAVALDGDVAAVGSFLDDDGGTNAGATYVFTRSSGGWAQADKLVPASAASGDRFGTSVSVDGSAILAGAPTASGTGSAFVFESDGASWVEEDRLSASDGFSGNDFGQWVALENGRALIGAPEIAITPTTPGATYLFEESGGAWSQSAKLVPVHASRGDEFGTAVALSGDVGVIGAPQDDDKGRESGSAFIFGLGPQVLEVAIDVKPGSDPNPVACAEPETVIPVAILSTREADGEPLDFDATTVDHATVSFEGAAELHVNRRTGEPIRHEEDVDADGDTDLVLHVRLGDTGLTCASTEGSLTGETFDGTAIEGTDAVRTVGG